MANKKVVDILLIVLVVLLVVSVAGLLSTTGHDNITGAVTADQTESRVTIYAFFSIALSDNLSAGIEFGNITSLPAVDINATHNYNESFPTTNGTLYFVSVSPDSNSDVDFCIRADDDLKNPGSDAIGLGNYTYNWTTTGNLSNQTLPPGPLNSAAFTTSYVDSEQDVGPGNSTFYRFWLDIPSNQEVGTYNNTILFLGKTTGVCP